MLDAMTILDAIAFGLQFTAGAAAMLLLTAMLAGYAALVTGFWR